MDIRHARRLVAAVALSSLVVGCAGTNGPPADRQGGGEIGYVVDGEEIVFRFVASDYVNVTRNDNGEWLSIGDVDIAAVSVAGDFNGWSREAWKLAPVQGGVYELRKTAAFFAGRTEAQFKFVLNGFYWVEPPTGARNRAASGAWGANRSYNLVLRIP